MLIKKVLKMAEFQHPHFPKYLGIHYTPEDFDFHSDQNTCDWKWHANQNAVAEIKAKGGQISRIDTRTIQSHRTQEILNFIHTHKKNHYIIQHFSQKISGLEVIVPKNTIIQEPLNLNIDVFNQLSSNYSLLLNLGSNSRITVNQQVIIAGQASNASLIMIGSQNDNSQLKLTTTILNQSNLNLVLFGNLDAARDCQTGWSLAPDVHGGLLGDVAINLNGQGSFGRLNVLKTGTASDHCGLQASVNHYAPHTKSRINMRGVLFGKSKVNFTSIGNIVKGAADSDTQQESRLMTVGETTHGTVNPVLLIDENDVNAGHAASVGQYDLDELYYLLSRGISMIQARKILVYDFISPVMQEFDKRTQKIMTADIEMGSGESLNDNL